MIHCVDMTSSEPAVTHVIPGGAGVTAVTSLGDDVFIVRSDRSQQVEVYDAVTFTLQRRLSVPGLGPSYGLAACASNKCLYASDNNNACVQSGADRQQCSDEVVCGRTTIRSDSEQCQERGGCDRI